MIRAGKIMRIPFSVKVIIPEVEILEPFFDFGGVMTLGNAG